MRASMRARGTIIPSVLATEAACEDTAAWHSALLRVSLTPRLALRQAANVDEGTRSETTLV